MKIVLSTTAPNIDADIDPRFGRCAYLLVVDTDTLDVEGQPNPGVDAAGGAGVQAAQFVSAQGAKAVISGDFGPNAFNALKAAGVAMYLYDDCHTARQAVGRFKTGGLPQVGAPTQRGHHG